MQIDDAEWAAHEWAETVRETRAVAIVFTLMLLVVLIGAVYLLLRIVR